MRGDGLKEKVEFILQTRPHTRNSDIELTMWIWYTYFQDFLEWEVIGEDGRWMVPLSSVRRLPSEDRISRFRRKFQETGLYPATDPAVIARRGREESIRQTITTEEWSKNL